jgi:hypothetical protein
MKIAFRIVPGLTCLALLAPASAADAPDLGRLFFTPERRLALERQRTHNVQEAQTLQGTTMSLDGVVQRSSGKSTIWINRQAQNENDGGRTGVSAAVSAKTPGSVLLAPGHGRTRYPPRGWRGGDARQPRHGALRACE